MPNSTSISPAGEPPLDCELADDELAPPGDLAEERLALRVFEWGLQLRARANLGDPFFDRVARLCEGRGFRGDPIADVRGGVLHAREERFVQARERLAKGRERIAAAREKLRAPAESDRLGGEDGVERSWVRASSSARRASSREPSTGS